MRYKVMSNYCGTLVSDKEYSETKAKELAAKWTKKAADIGFPEVTYSAICA